MDSPDLGNGLHVCRQCEKLGMTRIFSTHETALDHAIECHSSRVLSFFNGFDRELRERVIFWCLRRRSDV